MQKDQTNPTDSSTDAGHEHTYNEQGICLDCGSELALPEAEIEEALKQSETEKAENE